MAKWVLEAWDSTHWKKVKGGTKADCEAAQKLTSLKTRVRRVK